ncbi:hypothetical protein R2R35_19350 [Anaerocolumna sp. AGMB13020]|nr:hypothetical protein [Anaerocolumna sp. AGMB13020]WOO35930.1 hypothetical protein R2R35_19350 [Anaerocolumna sp. AGMB13020]
MITYSELSLVEILQIATIFENDKPAFLSLLENQIDLSPRNKGII